MKKMSVLLGAGLVAMGLLSGCATSYPIGGILTQLKLPVDVTAGDVRGMKVGKATCKSYLAMIATGDASIDAAKKNGGITKVHYMDWEVENILGIIGTYTLTVYGE